MKKKPMSSVSVKVNLMFMGFSILFILLTVTDSEVPQNIKFIISGVCLLIIIICTVIFISDFSIRKKRKINKISTIEEKEEIISVDEWNHSQIFQGAGNRSIYDEEINEVLGEKYIFKKKTDKYGNVVLTGRSNNIVTYLVSLIFGSGMTIIMLVLLFLGKTNILYAFVILILCVPLMVYSIYHIKRIKKLKIKINFFQILTLTFFVSLSIFVFGGIFISNADINIENVDIDKIVKYLFSFIMIIGFVAFIYQWILVIYAKIIKKHLKKQ